MKRASIVVAIACIVCVTTVTRAQAPPAPGVSTGEKIGNVVKTAITTAFPAVKDIVDLIWTKKPTTDNKVSKDQLQTATESAKKDVQTAITAAIQPKLTPLARVSGELATVDKFLQPTVVAAINLAQMQTRLAGPMPDWSEQEKDWKVAKAQLAQLRGITDPELDQVRDKWLKNTLAAIRGVNDQAVVRVEAEVSATKKNPQRQAVEIQALAVSLRDITAAIGYELSDLRTEMTDLADWAKGGQGGDRAGISATQTLYKNLIERKK